MKRGDKVRDEITGAEGIIDVIIGNDVFVKVPYNKMIVTQKFPLDWLEVIHDDSRHHQNAAH
jgi:hypothetical protein